jgi:fermentation-respiration switch protein FrsA (DUF1100 family)
MHYFDAVMPRLKRDTFFIATGDEHPVRADLYMPEHTFGVCILCHGFKCYKTWGFIPYLAGGLVDEGIAALAIDFSHNGTIPFKGRGGEDPLAAAQDTSPYISPGLFRKNTLARESSDLSKVLRDILETGLEGRLKPGVPMGLFGHSRGGVSAILNALQFKEVKAISTWSVPSHPDVFSVEQKRKWKERGSIDFTNASSSVAMAVDRVYLDDLEKHRDSYDMEEAVRRLQIPYLIVHGAIDIPVSAESAVKLYRAASSVAGKRLVFVKAGHAFGAATPFLEPCYALRKARNETIAWFTDHFS